MPSESSRWVNSIHQGNCRNVLGEIPDESVHAVVCDPPYGLAFMGRSWDDFEPKEYQQWCEQWARQALDVLKPGGHLLAFSGNRTHHRLFSGVEDAGFTVRDTLTWHYGSGFPKNTSAHLKPATEFVVLARKPCDGPAKDCHGEHGTAHLNIDGCRLEAGGGGSRDGEDSSERRYADNGGTNIAAKPGPRGGSSDGRYPANVIFDEFAAERLDDEVGDVGGSWGESTHGGGRDLYGVYADEERDEPEKLENVYETEPGGPSRYFYTSKATKAERTLNGQIDNRHPTVKPQDLMEWLVRLVTAEDQVVLDPFAGTGTTCKAAKELGRRFIGIEQQAKWADVARVRCGLEPEDPAHVRPDDDQTGLEVFVDG